MIFHADHGWLQGLIWQAPEGNAALLTQDLYNCFLEGDSVKDRETPGPGMLINACLHSWAGTLIQWPLFWGLWLSHFSPLWLSAFWSLALPFCPPRPALPYRGRRLLFRASSVCAPSTCPSHSAILGGNGAFGSQPLFFRLLFASLHWVNKGSIVTFSSACSNWPPGHLEAQQLYTDFSGFF